MKKWRYKENSDKIRNYIKINNIKRVQMRGLNGEKHTLKY